MYKLAVSASATPERLLPQHLPVKGLLSGAQRLRWQMRRPTGRYRLGYTGGHGGKMSDAEQKSPPVTPQQARRDEREAALQAKERALRDRLERVKKEQLELTRTTEEKEAERKRQCILLGQQLLKRAKKDPAAAGLVLSLIEEMAKKDKPVMEPIREQMEK